MVFTVEDDVNGVGQLIQFYTIIDSFNNRNRNDTPGYEGKWSDKKTGNHDGEILPRSNIGKPAPRV